VKKLFWCIMVGAALSLHSNTNAWSQQKDAKIVPPPITPPKIGADAKPPEAKQSEVKQLEAKPEAKPELKQPEPEAKQSDIKQAAFFQADPKQEKEAKQPEAQAPEKKDDAPKAPTAEEYAALKKSAEDSAAGLAQVKLDWKVGADTVWVMITAMLVFFMNLGFACVESGMCRAKNCVNILSKNFIVFAVTTIGFWLLGWGIMFGKGNEWVGKEGLVGVKGADNSPAAYSSASPSFEDKLKADVKDTLDVDLKDEKVAAANKPIAEQVDKYVEQFNKTTSNKVEKKDDKGKVVMKDGKAEEVDNVIAVKIEHGGKTLETTYKTADYYWGVYDSIAWATVPLWAKFFFQLVFAGTAATIVSGAVAERIKYHSFIIFSFVMAIAIYPVVGHWVWGGGKLQAAGFLDFAGSTQVHSIGGWAALIGVIILGPRIGKYGAGGKVNAIPGHNMTAATIGCLILWFGWFGFNPGSTMGIDPPAMAEVAVTTNLAAAMATLTATITSWLILGKPDIGMTLNGCLAGLVAITAPCAFVSAESSLIIGAIAGVIVVLGVIGFDKIGIDDPVGATSVHLLNGVFGTLCVGLFATADRIPRALNPAAKPGLFAGGNADQLIMQLTGVLYTAVYVMAVSAVAWIIIKATVGMRVSPQEEVEGLDIGEHGNEAYHGFAMIAPEILTSGSEPKPATMPKDAKKRFTVVVEGLTPDKIAAIWGDLCQPTKKPSADFLAIYPKMTLLQGNRFKFIEGNPEQISAHLAKVLQGSANGGTVKTFVEK
jgi:Amt family ammonium transporter